MIIPVQVLLGQLGVVCNYVFIRQRQDVDVTGIFVVGLITAAYQVVWIGTLLFGGIVSKNAFDIVKLWRHFTFESKADAKLMSKFRKSCRPSELRT
jgi:Zn-dependent membrane protease YugP